MNTAEIRNLIGPDRVMDVREIPCSVKHGLIIQTFRDLAVGDHFILVNGHDPKPLYYQFAAEWPGTFTWETVLNEPQEVRVKISKTKSLESPGVNLNSGCPSAT